MIDIRDAKVDDIEQITEIYNWAVRNTTATFDVFEQTLEKRREWFSHYGGKFPLIIAELNEKVVGYCSLSKFREKEAYAETVEISVYISPEYQGKGIGSILLGTIIDKARVLGHHVIIAGITTENEASIKLHEKFGFKLAGHFREVGYKFERWQDVLFYQLIL